MKIPTVKMTVPVFSEREYAKTPASIESSLDMGVKMEKIEVSLEYASFLINSNPLYINGWHVFPRAEYIDELFEAFVSTDRGNEMLESLTGEITMPQKITWFSGILDKMGIEIYKKQKGAVVFTEESAVKLIKRSLNRMLDNAIENDNTSTLDWI